MTEQTASPTTVKQFLAKLPSVALDRFVRVMCTLQQEGSAQALALLEEQLSLVKASLSKIEVERNVLKARHTDIKAVLKDVDAAVGDTGKDGNLLQFRILLHGLDTEAERQIAESRPLSLLREKALLKKQIKRLRDMAHLATSLMDEAY